MTNSKQRVRINDTFSSWAEVISGIPQGSVLGPVLFIIYINDLIECCSSWSDIFLFADDAKLFLYVKTEEDSKQLQKDLDKFKEWIDTWLLSLNIGKCKNIPYVRKIDIFSKYTIIQYQIMLLSKLIK